MSAEQLQQLRAQTYNAVLTHVRSVHADLRILRVQPSTRIPFVPGQYVTLGLGEWEPTHRGGMEQPCPAAGPDNRRATGRIIQRAYSVSSRMLDAQGRLVRLAEEPFLEFYVALAPASESHAPQLTPRLFALRPGDRLLLGPHAHGSYTLQYVADGDNVLFCGTGTGEAPHNAMLVELLSRAHRGRIVMLTSVRRRADIAYEAVHRELERRYPTYRYVALTTREPENLEPLSAGYVGKRRLQDYVRSGGLERDTGLQLASEPVQAYLCGNPQMIGLRRRPEGGRPVSDAGGMVRTLEEFGLRLDEPGRAGAIHTEQYWASGEESA